MKQDVETYPPFCDADTFSGIAEDFLRGTRGISCGIRLIPVNRNFADLRRALDIFFGNIGDRGFCKFRHGSLEEARHDGSLGKQPLRMLVVDRVLIKRRRAFRQTGLYWLHGVTFFAFIIAWQLLSSQEKMMGLCSIPSSPRAPAPPRPASAATSRCPCRNSPPTAYRRPLLPL